MTNFKQINVWGKVADEEAKADKKILDMVSRLGGLDEYLEENIRLKRKQPKIKYI